MSAQPASSAVEFAPFPCEVPHEPPASRRLFGLWIRLLTGTVVSAIVALLVLLYSPTVLSALSALFLKPQPGLVPWNGRDRITVVAMGLTQRTTEPARTDTLLVMDIDPANRRINMLSVPRDLWVNVPGVGQSKLANAYAVGGPHLTAYALERELGIPVDYSVALTFRGFMRIVDAMGGISVTVPQELKDPTYPCLTGYNYCPIDIKPGPQHMDGARALEFVRERHAFAQQDLARVRDQQAFSVALKQTLLSPLTWPRFPAMAQAVQSGLISNLPANDLPLVASQFGRPLTNVNHSYINIENGMVKPDWSADGQSILLPTDPSAIPNLVHRLFADPGIAQENAAVAVLNGTGTPGLAAGVQGSLQKLGFRTTFSGNADTASYAKSQVIINQPVSGTVDYTARRLQRLLDADLVRRPVAGQNAQIVVIVGKDFPTS